jgi:hypothetical protein
MGAAVPAHADWASGVPGSLLRDRIEMAQCSRSGMGSVIGLRQCVAYGLRFEGRRRIHKADELIAWIAAEKLANHIDRSILVVMQKPPGRAHSLPPKNNKPEGG